MFSPTVRLANRLVWRSAETRLVACRDGATRPPARRPRSRPSPRSKPAIERTSSRAPEPSTPDDRDDLAGPRRAGRCPSNSPAGVRPAGQPQRRCAASSPRADDDLLLRLALGLAGHEPGRDALLGQRLALEDVGADAVEDERDAVGVLGQLGEPVRDEEDDAPGVGEQVHPPEEVVRLLLGQRGVRLVEQEDARVARQRAADLDALLDRQRDLARAGGRRTSRIARSRISARSCGVRGRADHAPRPLAADHEVLGHGQVREQLGLLVDDRDAVAIEARCPTDAPSSSISPRRRRVSPARILMSVLLPAPFGPATPRISPGAGLEVEAVEGAGVAVPLAQPADAEAAPGAAVAGSAAAPSPPRSLAEALGEAVEHDGRDRHGARHEVAQVRAGRQEREAVGDDRQQQRAAERADGRAAAARQARAADDDRREDREQVSPTPAFGWIEPMNAKSSIAARDASSEQMMKAANLYLTIGQPRELGRGRVAADRLEPEAEQRAAEEEADDDRDRRSSRAPASGCRAGGPGSTGRRTSRPAPAGTTLPAGG